MPELTALPQLAAGGALVLVAWLLPRCLAGAGIGASAAALIVDAAPMGLGAGLLVLATGRPIFAGTIVVALGAGLALTDYTMRQTLREPVVFSESVELLQVFSHPHLYLPFAGPGLVVGGAAVAVAVAAALLIFEPALWSPHPVAALTALASVAAAAWLTARRPLLDAVAGRLRRCLEPSGEPFADAAALGPFAMLLVHTMIARAERHARQRALAAAPLVPAGSGAAGRPGRAAGRPIVIVQCESFFDARRLGSQIPAELLAGFDRCCRSAAMHGRLQVPGWGANTMRSEFAVLTGIPDGELGYDRFNPYYALARVPLESEVWRLRRAGYRTICLHPFDRRFFRRDLVMPALGFSEFRGRESIGGARRPPYCPDPELAECILRTLDEDGPETFIFCITMGNHGPWLPGGGGVGAAPVDPTVARLFDPTEMPEGHGLLRYLDGLRRSDAMLEILMDGLTRRGMPAVLAFYGDHLPSLPRAFKHFGFADGSSDYAIWPDLGSEGAPLQRDLPAHRLGRIVIDAALDAAPGARPRSPAKGAAA